MIGIITKTCMELLNKVKGTKYLRHQKLPINCSHLRDDMIAKMSQNSDKKEDKK